MGGSTSSPATYESLKVEAKDSATETDQIETTDITIYGATGFVARHVGKYLISAINAIHDCSGHRFTITLAGRNLEKLHSRLEELTEYHKVCAKKTEAKIDFDIWVADCDDIAALKSMCKQTKVVINCAGPFHRYGAHVVEACATIGTDYVDITGEVEWASLMRRQFGALAAKSGSRIVSFCGFDSIPSDISVYISVKKWREEVRNILTGSKNESNVTLNVQSAKTWHSVFGGINGGTLHTALNTPINVRKCLFDDNEKLRPFPFFFSDPFCLVDPKICDSTSQTVQHWKYSCAKSEWINNLISVDPEMKFAVSNPFFMAPVNAKIVQASAVALKYSPSVEEEAKYPVKKNFTYKERILPLGFPLSRKIGILSIFPAVINVLVLGIVTILFSLPFLGKFIANKVLPPGSGTSDALNEKGKAEVYALINGEINSENNDKVLNDLPDRASCHIQFQGDPGNLVTAQCVAESALCLTLNRSELPERSFDGFGTPAEILGDVFVKRLTENTVRPVLIESKVWKDGKREKNKNV